MADVFEVLAADHQEVKSLLSRLNSGLGSEDRAELAETLVIEESKHEALEEMYFWPAVRESVTDGNELADSAVGQEDEGKQVLELLAKASAGTDEFDGLLSKFHGAALEHIAFEEGQVWPKLRSALDAKARDDLGTKIVEGKKSAPTRPHPNTPSSPGVLKTAGVAAAATDKIRDKLAGRGN